MIGPVEGEIGSLAQLQILHSLGYPRMRHVGDDEHAWRNALADRVVNDAHLREHSTVLLRHQNLGQFAKRRGRAMHAGLVGHQPGCVGDRRHLDHGL